MLTRFRLHRLRCYCNTPHHDISRMRGARQVTFPTTAPRGVSVSRTVTSDDACNRWSGEGGRHVIIWTRFPSFSIHPHSDSRCPSTDAVPASISTFRCRRSMKFICNVGKEDIFRRRQLHVFSECHLNSNLTASTLLMCYVCGGRIAVTVEHDDG